MRTEKCCSHRFVATTRKGKWNVLVSTMNNRGNESVEEVITTIFKCSLCGAKKEFPDKWEKNYIVPKKSNLK